MEGFIRSFSPLLSKYRSEIILLSAALILALISLAPRQLESNSSAAAEELEPAGYTATASEPKMPAKIQADIAGSVVKPGVYELSADSRLNELLKKAGGLSDEADRNFFGRNFNLAKRLGDQEKIYVPAAWEISSGIVSENSLVSQSAKSLISEVTNDMMGPNEALSTLININTAVAEELDVLPGVGAVTANKIIAGRPYSAIDQLLSKKIVNKGVYEKIKPLITK